MTAAPLVGISACSRSTGALPFQWVGLKYIEAIALGSEATPLLIPALGAALDVMLHRYGFAYVVEDDVVVIKAASRAAH